MFLWFQVGYGLDFSKHIETEECQFKNIPHALTNEVGLKQSHVKTASFIIIKMLTFFFLNFNENHSEFYFFINTKLKN